MSKLATAWYTRAIWPLLLWPLSVLFRVTVALRKAALGAGRRGPPASKPVVVIGNISVGGTGKTPLLMALIEALGARGYRVGVISRGYGGRSPGYPRTVSKEDDAAEVGDEPLLIATACGCPVVVDPRRSRALGKLLAEHEVDVVLSDDGLQHYRLYRDLEIAVVDSVRLFGNRQCLPAGPLREPVKRLTEVEAIVVNGALAEPTPELEGAFPMRLQPSFLLNLLTGEQRHLQESPFPPGGTIQAVAGIGHPQRFYQLLEQALGPVRAFSFPDHHQFSRQGLVSAGVDLQQPIVMTEKDGIKCRSFAEANWWVLHVAVSVPVALPEIIINHLQNKRV